GLWGPCERVTGNRATALGHGRVAGRGRACRSTALPLYRLRTLQHFQANYRARNCRDGHARRGSCVGRRIAGAPLEPVERIAVIEPGLSEPSLLGIGIAAGPASPQSTLYPYGPPRTPGSQEQ